LLECGFGRWARFGVAARFFQKSADLGNGKAQTAFGDCLQKGQDVERDLEKAAEYFRMAAEQGNAFGELRYAMCLERGMGVKEDRIQAMKYFQMAADQGYAEASAG
jgi:TPR repeat protein